MKLNVGTKTVEVNLPKLTLRTEPTLRAWYNRLQDVARQHVLETDLLARLYSAAIKRGIDLSHIITPSGEVSGEAKSLPPDEVQRLLLQAIVEDVELVRILVGVDRYPRTADAIKLAIDFLREVGGVELSEDEWQDVSFDEIAACVEAFFRSFRG